MLLPGYNFTRWVPKIRARRVSSRPTGTLQTSVTGSRRERVYQVRARTEPRLAESRAPKCSVSSRPEIRICPSSTVIPGRTSFSPQRASTLRTSPARRATRLDGVRRSAISGSGSRSRTWTWAWQPETLTAIQLSSGISRRTWFRRSSDRKPKPKVPRRTPLRWRARRISSSLTARFPSMVKSQIKKEPRKSPMALMVSPTTRAYRLRKRRRK